METPTPPAVPPEASTTASTPAPQTAAPQVTAQPTVLETISIEQFAMTKLRVAQIEAAEAIPKSKKLLKLQVNLGEQLGKRQILAGIALHYTPESLIGRKIIVVANLQKAVLMGQESQGMLLAASSPDGSKLVIVDPGQDLAPGSEVR